MSQFAHRPSLSFLSFHPHTYCPSGFSPVCFLFRPFISCLHSFLPPACLSLPLLSRPLSRTTLARGLFVFIIILGDISDARRPAFPDWQKCVRFTRACTQAGLPLHRTALAYLFMLDNRACRNRDISVSFLCNCRKECGNKGNGLLIILG